MVIEWIVAAVIGVGIFFGGWFTRDLTKPTTNIVNVESKTTVSTEQKTEVRMLTAQITMVDMKTNLNVNLTGLSNSIISLMTNTNFNTSITNK